MKGKVLDYDDDQARGLISGDDGERYPFTRGDLEGGVRSVAAGAVVDFETVGGRAAGIYVTATPGGLSGERNRITAALLAFFLGLFGAHKFYLRRTGPGVLMLAAGTIGWIFLAIPPLVVGVISLVEFAIYLGKSDAEFQRDYVAGNRAWF